MSGEGEPGEGSTRTAAAGHDAASESPAIYLHVVVVEAIGTLLRARLASWHPSSGTGGSATG